MKRRISPICEKIGHLIAVTRRTDMNWLAVPRPDGAMVVSPYNHAPVTYWKASCERGDLKLDHDSEGADEELFEDLIAKARETGI
jgi:hypothetical protein